MSTQKTGPKSRRHSSWDKQYEIKLLNRKLEDLQNENEIITNYDYNLMKLLHLIKKLKNPNSDIYILLRKIGLKHFHNQDKYKISSYKSFTNLLYSLLDKIEQVKEEQLNKRFNRASRHNKDFNMHRPVVIRQGTDLEVVDNFFVFNQVRLTLDEINSIIIDGQSYLDELKEQCETKDYSSCAIYSDEYDYTKDITA